MTEPSEEMIRMARRIAAHALCGPEKWKPGVKAGMFDDIMRGAADTEAIVLGPLQAIIETTELAAAFIEREGMTTNHAGIPVMAEVNQRLATEIRTGNHYTKDESNGN